MANEIKPPGHGPQVNGAVSMPGFGQQEVAVDKGKKATQSDAPVSHADKPIDSRDVEKGLTTAEKLDKLSGIMNKLTSKKPVDVQQVEGDLKGLQEDFTMAYEVVNLMGDGEEISAVKQFLENVLSIIKSLLIFVGIMKQVDDKGNLPPEKQKEADLILADVEHNMEKLGAQEKPKGKASAMPIEQHEQILGGSAHQASPPSPPSMPPATGSRPKTSSPAAEPSAAPPMPAQVAPAPAAVAKRDLSALLAQIQAGKSLKKADSQMKQEEEKTFAQAELDKRREVIVDDDGPEEVFEDEFDIPQSSPTPEAPKKEEAKVFTPKTTAPVTDVERPKAAPQDLLAALRKGGPLKHVKTENRSPVKTEADAQKDALARSPLLGKVQAEEPVDDDKWDD